VKSSAKSSAFRELDPNILDGCSSYILADGHWHRLWSSVLNSHNSTLGLALLLLLFFFRISSAKGFLRDAGNRASPNMRAMQDPDSSLHQ
jgi:hypothetical protein